MIRALRAAAVLGGMVYGSMGVGGVLIPLGDLRGGSTSSFAHAVNSDGSVVVGRSGSASGTEAFRWAAPGGMTGLGDFAGGSFNSLANGVSSDGSVVVGYGEVGGGGIYQAFRWTAAGGMVGLGDLSGGISDSQAYAVSGNGSVVVGKAPPPPASRRFAGRMPAGWSG